MKNFFLLLYLIISFVNAGKISQHLLLTVPTWEYLLSVQDVHEDYISIQLLFFSPFQGIYDKNYKKLSDRLSVLYDSLLNNLKPINDISEIELSIIDNLNNYLRLLSDTITQLRYICMRLYPSNEKAYSFNEYSEDIAKWDKLCEKYKLYRNNIIARLDELTISVPRFNSF